jgi:hypothetical protein
MIGHLILYALLAYGYATPRTFGPAQYAYSATATFTLPTATVLNDFVTFTGSATRTVYITGLEKQCSVATAPVNWQNVMVRRTSETGGTFRPWAVASYDKNAPAATAVMGDYSLGVTSGNSGGTVFMQRYIDRVLVNSFATSSDVLRDSWGKGYARTTHNGQLWSQYPIFQPTGFRPGSPLVLRGTNDILALTIGSSFPNAITCRFNVEWFEVPNTTP